jgi:hypothetical protein
MYNSIETGCRPFSNLINTRTTPPIYIEAQTSSSLALVAPTSVVDLAHFDSSGWSNRGSLSSSRFMDTMRAVWTLDAYSNVYVNKEATGLTIWHTSRVLSWMSRSGIPAVHISLMVERSGCLCFAIVSRVWFLEAGSRSRDMHGPARFCKEKGASSLLTF